MMNHDQPPDTTDRSEQEGVRPDVYEARITGSRETLTRLIQEFKLDVGCRHPDIEARPDGTGTLLFYASRERLAELQSAGHHVEQGENVSALGRERQKEVGQGDRFRGGRTAPRGLGGKPGSRKEAQ
jgi:hypothetical protein